MDTMESKYERAILMTCGCLTSIENFRNNFTKGLIARRQADAAAVSLILTYETFLALFKGETTSPLSVIYAPVEKVNERLEWAIQKFADYLRKNYLIHNDGKPCWSQPRDRFMSLSLDSVTEMWKFTYQQAKDLIIEQGALYRGQVPKMINDDWLETTIWAELPDVRGLYEKIEQSQ